MPTRARAFGHLVAAEPGSERVEALCDGWLQAPEARLRLAACRISSPDVALPVLAALAKDPRVGVGETVSAVGLMGALDHPGAVPALRAIERTEAEVVAAVATALAGCGEAGGGLALTDGGEGGELAVQTTEGAVALEAQEAEDPPSRPGRIKA